MKKIAFLMLAVLALSVPASYAAETASYDEMKAIKAKQRTERDARKAAIKSGSHEPSKMEKFWQNEGERSGLHKPDVNGFFAKLNPMPFFAKQREDYEARRTSGGVK